MKAVRTTISPPPEQLQHLQKIADQRGLPLVWVTRQAENEFPGRTEERRNFDPLATLTEDRG